MSSVKGIKESRCSEVIDKPMIWIEKMKKLIYVVFILFLATPLFSDDKPIFEALQFTTWALIDLDTICTYNSIWNYRLGEANPFWKSKLNKPTLVFALDMAIKIGIIWGTSKIYKKNKYIAYFLIVVVNIVQVHCIHSHLKAWRGN